LSVRGTRNQYSKDNENKFHGVGSPWRCDSLLFNRDHWRCVISAPMDGEPERVAFIHGCGENSINQRPPFLDNETCPLALPAAREAEKDWGR
jgi:hypothetical protein